MDGMTLMLRWLFNAVHQERRRLLFVVILAYLSGLLAYWQIEVVVAGLPAAVFIASAQAVVVFIAALFICLAFPAMRFMLEAIAVARFALASAIFIAPGLSDVLLVDPLVTTFCVVGGGFAFSRLLHGRIVRRRSNWLRDQFMPSFQRMPAKLIAMPWQRRFVHWIDDARPVAISV